MSFARRTSRWGIADRVQATGEARLCCGRSKRCMSKIASRPVSEHAPGVFGCALRRSRSNYVAAEPPGTEDQVQSAPGIREYRSTMVARSDLIEGRQRW